MPEIVEGYTGQIRMLQESCEGSLTEVRGVDWGASIGGEDKVTILVGRSGFQPLFGHAGGVECGNDGIYIVLVGEASLFVQRSGTLEEQGAGGVPSLWKVLKGR